MSWEQGCLGSRVVSGTGLSRVQGCLGYRVVSGTGFLFFCTELTYFNFFNHCLGYRVVSGTGLSRVQGYLGTGLYRISVISFFVSKTNLARAEEDSKCLSACFYFFVLN